MLTSCVGFSLFRLSAYQCLSGGYSKCPTLLVLYKRNDGAYCRKIFIMKTYIIVFICVLFLVSSCNSKKRHAYEDHLPKEVLDARAELSKVEALNGYEEEKRIARCNVATGELLYLISLFYDFKNKYDDENGKMPSVEEINQFKQEIRFDSLLTEFEKSQKANCSKFTPVDRTMFDN